ASWHEDSALLIKDGRSGGIVSVEKLPGGAVIEQAKGNMLVPGFVDLQVNGGGGVLFNDHPDLAGIRRICVAHSRFGSTALMPTLITDTPEKTNAAINAAIAAARENVPGFLGLHLEGPHLSHKRKGAHSADLLRPMSRDDLEALISARQRLPNLLITCAPESVTLEQVRQLAAAGVCVSLGHTDCSRDTALAYVEAGAGLVTHLFNAMSPLAHREPGLPGAALDSGRLSAGLIVDGFHVDPAVIRIALRSKAEPGRLFLVTDAMSTIGSESNGFELNGRRVFRRGGRLTLEDGTLAGADIDMAASIRVLTDRVGAPLETALRMASLYPAQALGIAGRKGTLVVGADADFVELDSAQRVVRSVIGGVAVFGDDA
nr:N-acetylglucosamine-6-phosphate deacetylase [Hyphomicrobiales bacterium]